MVSKYPWGCGKGCGVWAAGIGGDACSNADRDAREANLHVSAATRPQAAVRGLLARRAMAAEGHVDLAFEDGEENASRFYCA